MCCQESMALLTLGPCQVRPCLRRGEIPLSTTTTTFFFLLSLCALCSFPFFFYLRYAVGPVSGVPLRKRKRNEASARSSALSNGTYKGVELEHRSAFINRLETTTTPVEIRLKKALTIKVRVESILEVIARAEIDEFQDVRVEINENIFILLHNDRLIYWAPK